MNQNKTTERSIVVPRTKAVRDLIARNSGRRRRRFWVVTMFSSLALFAAVYVAVGLADALLEGKNEANYAVPAMLLGLIFLSLFLFAAMLLRATTQQAADRDMDERQKIVRNRAYFRAYQVMSIAVVVLLAYLMLAPQASMPWLPPVGGVAASPLYLGICYAIFVLPNAIVAWTEPGAESEGDAP